MPAAHISCVRTCSSSRLCGGIRFQALSACTGSFRSLTGPHSTMRQTTDSCHQLLPLAASMTSLVLPAIQSTLSTNVVGSGVTFRRSLRFPLIWHTSRCPATQCRSWHWVEQYQSPLHKHLRHWAASMQITQIVRSSSFAICPSSRSTDPSGAVIRSILTMALLLAHSKCTDTD